MTDLYWLTISLEVPIPLLQDVSWAEVKQFFRQQDKIISESLIE